VQDLSVGLSVVNSDEQLPMSGCLGDLVQMVEKFEVHVGDPS